MSPVFYFMAALTLAGAVAAMAMRNPVHCALSLVVTFAGLAGIYLGLGAQFLGLAQVLVYIGAVAILLVFVLLVTRTGAGEGRPAADGEGWRAGVPVAVAVGGVMAAAVWQSGRWLPVREKAPTLPGVRDIGQSLMTDFVLPLQVVGVLLTAAMIGAAIVVLREQRGGRKRAGGKGGGS